MCVLPFEDIWGSSTMAISRHHHPNLRDVRIPAVHLRHLGLKPLPPNSVAAVLVLYVGLARPCVAQYREPHYQENTHGENPWTLHVSGAMSQKYWQTCSGRVLLCTCRLLQTISDPQFHLCGTMAKDLERKIRCIPLYWVRLKPTFGGIFTH